MGSMIAVVGGSGFIGQSLIPMLQAQGHAVRILDVVRPPAELANTEFRLADVTDRSALVSHLEDCSQIVNLAAVHRDDVKPVSLYDDVNVKGAENICAAAEALKIGKITFTSSVAVYGFQAGIADETTAPQPFNDYGRTKWEAEKVFTAWQQKAPGERRLVIVRPTVVFGPGNRGNVYNLFAQLASGRFVMVGDGQNRKSMAYVKNVAAFIAFIMGFEPNRNGILVYNYCDTEPYSMNELVVLVREAMGRKKEVGFRIPYPVGLVAGSIFDMAAVVSGMTFPISRIRVEKFCASTVFATDRMRQTGFAAPFALRQAVIDTVANEFAAPASG